MLKKVFIILSCLGLLFSSDLCAKPPLKTMKKKTINEDAAKETPAQEEQAQENSAEQTADTQKLQKGMPSTDNPIEGQISESKETSVTDQSGHTQKVTTIEFF